MADGLDHGAHDRAVSRSPDVDPARAVAQPVEHALGALIAGAVASFALSIAATLFAVLTPDGMLHEASHFALVAVMASVILARAVHVLRRRGGTRTDAWAQARAVQRWDAQLAQVLTIAVPVAWLVGGVTILVRHLVTLNGAALLIGVWLPVAAGVWIVAAFAWHDFCHDRLAGALDESSQRYRDYWRDIAGRS